ncbi:hypothetical protein IFT48_03955 [Pseudomonas fluorescens]|uniref:hypothetical protein n=1 Tax=Pseudomonas fluorescens TaxID=294 RepID=UPI001930D12C|nr:hypothetical protein [Pseudomonas fluorescens]MBD8089125.1 hypothetical protein [Pseudomonas fluorescens]
MTILNLKNIHPNQVVDHMLIACEQFVEDDATDCARHIKEHLRVAQSMSEEILAHYGSLEAASRALRGVCSQNQKLPENVLLTFLYACIQEHPLLEVILSEVHEMYGESAPSPEYRIIAGFMASDRRFVVMPKPQMISNAGDLLHDPQSFKFVHGTAFDNEIKAVLRKGSGEVERLLSLYPDMRAGSQKLMDAELCRRVYVAELPDYSPIRATLREKLDDVQDAHFRIDFIFESEFELEPNDVFTRRLDFAFNFIDALSREKAQAALAKLDRIISSMIAEDPFVEGDAVEGMTRILKRANRNGYDPLAVIVKDMLAQSGESAAVHGILDNLMASASSDTAYTLWAQAAVLSMDDEKLLGLDLAERHLAWIAGRTGSQKIREQLKKTDTGRDVVFGQDLGL